MRAGGVRTCRTPACPAPHGLKERHAQRAKKNRLAGEGDSASPLFCNAGGNTHLAVQKDLSSSLASALPVNRQPARQLCLGRCERNHALALEQPQQPHTIVSGHRCGANEAEQVC